MIDNSRRENDYNRERPPFRIPGWQRCICAGWLLTSKCMLTCTVFGNGSSSDPKARSSDVQNTTLQSQPPDLADKQCCCGLHLLTSWQRILVPPQPIATKHDQKPHCKHGGLSRRRVLVLCSCVCWWRQAGPPLVFPCLRRCKVGINAGVRFCRWHIAHREGLPISAAPLLCRRCSFSTIRVFSVLRTHLRLAHALMVFQLRKEEDQAIILYGSKLELLD
eukprot:5754724-Amphidinium_carterae.2